MLFLSGEEFLEFTYQSHHNLIDTGRTFRVDELDEEKFVKCRVRNKIKLALNGRHHESLFFEQKDESINILSVCDRVNFHFYTKKRLYILLTLSTKTRSLIPVLKKMKFKIPKIIRKTYYDKISHARMFKYEKIKSPLFFTFEDNNYSIIFHKYREYNATPVVSEIDYFESLEKFTLNDSIVVNCYCEKSMKLFKIIKDNIVDIKTIYISHPGKWDKRLEFNRNNVQFVYENLSFDIRFGYNNDIKLIETELDKVL